MKIKKQLIYGDNPIINYLPQIHKKDMNGIMYLISNLANRFLEHKHDAYCLSISREMKYDLFGQYRWRNKIYNNPEHIFNKLFILQFAGNSYEKITSGYKPSQLLITAYYKWLSLNPSFELVDVTDKSIEVKGVEINDDEKAISDFREEVEINIEPIQETYIKHMNPILDYISKGTNEPNKELYEFVRYQIVPLRNMLEYIKSNDNKLKIYYKQSDSGRYYSVGKYSIHALKREVRSVILNDYNEYDISVSAPLLLSQIYSEITKEKVPKTISDYIKNKKRIREIFSEKYKVSIDDSKQYFTALFFGSRLIPNDFKYHSSITKTLGKDIVDNILIDKTSYESKLYFDVKKLFKVISNHYKKIDKEKVIGYNNHTIHLDKWKSETVVAHLYQSLESVILESMIKFYTTTTGDNNYIRVHDCLYTKKEIDKRDLYYFIKKDTGYDTLFKEPISKQYTNKVLYSMFNID